MFSLRLCFDRSMVFSTFLAFGGLQAWQPLRRRPFRLLCCFLYAVTLIGLIWSETGESASRTSIEGALALVVQTNTNSLSEGDVLEIEAIVKNVFQSEVLFDGGRRESTVGNVKMKGLDGLQLPSYMLAIPSIRQLTRSGLRRMMPGDELVVKFRGQFGQKGIPDIQAPGYPIIYGLFLDFRDSAILVPVKGKYNIEVEISNTEMWAKQVEKEMQLSQVWYGRLVGTVPIEIR